MQGRYWEDLEVGQEFRTVGRTIGEAQVMTFAGLSGDFNPLHTDATIAETTPWKKRIAHGILGLSIASGLINQLGLFEGTTIALLGYEEWRFTRPIFFGDTIHVEMKIIDKRETSKPDRGILMREINVVNQNGEVVQTGRSGLMVMRRPADQAIS